jgi:cell filamentation protein
MTKGKSRFCQGAFVEVNSKNIFNNLEKDNFLRDFGNQDSKIFSRKISHYQGEIISLHPFYELNGRITHLFFDMIAVYNRYEFIDYSVVSADEYIQASIDCVQLADSNKLLKIIENGLKC